MTETLPTLVIGADLILTLTEGCALSERPLAISDLAEYADCTVRAAREGVKAAVWLGLIELQNGKYAAAPTARPEFPASAEQKILFFRGAIQKKKPFIQFAALLASGNEARAACQKVRVLYQINSAPDTLTRLFSGWGKSSGILTDDKGQLRLKPEYTVPDLPLEYLEGIKDALESDLKARIFIARKLTDEPFRLIPDAGIERAVRALRGVSADPRNAVEDAGELLEDYLRAKAVMTGLNASGANGIGGVVQLLDAHGSVTGEHRTISSAMNTLRIMAAHPIRASTSLRWAIRQDS